MLMKFDVVWCVLLHLQFRIRIKLVTVKKNLIYLHCFFLIEVTTILSVCVYV